METTESIAFNKGYQAAIEDKEDAGKIPPDYINPLSAWMRGYQAAINDMRIESENPTSGKSECL